MSVPSHVLPGGRRRGNNGVPSPRGGRLTSLAGRAAGQVYLADSAVGVRDAGAGATIDYSPGKVIDFFGYGTAAAYETAVKAGTITTAGSYKRTTLTDNDNNNTDFVISPVNAASGSGTGVGPDSCDCVATSSLKITEVYADGGVSGSAIDHDFIEIQTPPAPPCP